MTAVVEMPDGLNTGGWVKVEAIRLIPRSDGSFGLRVTGDLAAVTERWEWDG